MTDYPNWDPSTPDDEGVCKHCGSRRTATLEEGIAVAYVPFKVDPDHGMAPAWDDPRYNGWDGPEETHTVGELCGGCYREAMYRDNEPRIIVPASELRRTIDNPTAMHAAW